eukprot:TRINITY_DN25856_c0_g4_i1.p1 TRINITY_DN25856_c0_g4~~TRINITY_DN25856_c0_g4_i1.p1  ORF type:complete len:438 (+),score=126.74 TRINITY_DN25856_c0_g4_i1:82-1314(+)
MDGGGEEGGGAPQRFQPYPGGGGGSGGGGSAPGGASSQALLGQLMGLVQRAQDQQEAARRAQAEQQRRDTLSLASQLLGQRGGLPAAQRTGIANLLSAATQLGPQGMAALAQIGQLSTALQGHGASGMIPGMGPLGQPMLPMIGGLLPGGHHQPLPLPLPGKGMLAGPGGPGKGKGARSDRRNRRGGRLAGGGQPQQEKPPARPPYTGPPIPQARQTDQAAPNPELALDRRGDALRHYTGGTPYESTDPVYCDGCDADDLHIAEDGFWHSSNSYDICNNCMMTRVLRVVEVEPKHVGLVVGTGASQLQRLQRRFPAVVFRVPRRGDVDQHHIRLIGPEPDLEQAEAQIHECIAEHQRKVREAAKGVSATKAGGGAQEQLAIPAPTYAPAAAADDGGNDFLAPDLAETGLS